MSSKAPGVLFFITEAEKPRHSGEVFLRMTSSRRKFTPEEKARIVLEILKEEKSVSQLASEHGIHANVLNRWKSEAIQNLSQLFVDDRKGITKMKNDYEQQINELYAEIGKLTSQLSWLKKKSGL